MSNRFLRDAIIYENLGINTSPIRKLASSFPFVKPSSSFTFVKPSSASPFAKPTSGIQFGKLTSSINSVKIQKFFSFFGQVKEKYFLKPRRSESLFFELFNWRVKIVISVYYRWFQLEGTGSLTYKKNENWTRNPRPVLSDFWAKLFLLCTEQFRNELRTHACHL